MDTAGAIAGPVVTLILLATVAASLTRADAYRLILLLAAVPALVSVLVVLMVREPPRTPTRSQPLRVAFRGIPRPLLVFLGIASLFSFADFSYVFLLLRAGILFGTTQAILLYVLYNVVYAAHAFPAGILSDRVGRKPVVLIGYLAFIAMSTLLAVSGEFLVLVAAFILYGLSYGMAEGTQRALVADFAPAEIKATVLGAYHTSIGIVRLGSGVVAGLLWIVFIPQATFAFGAIAAAVAAIGLALWKPPVKS
jgi:MFS family permease